MGVPRRNNSVQRELQVVRGSSVIDETMNQRPCGGAKQANIVHIKLAINRRYFDRLNSCLRSNSRTYIGL